MKKIGHTPKQIQDKINAIKELYELGRQSLAKQVTRSPKEHAKEAKERDVEPWRLAHARLLADPNRGFKKDEIRQIFDLFREHGFALGSQALLRLRTVDSLQRQKLMKTAIRQRWTKTQLDLHISTRLGARKHAGRRPHIPADRDTLIAQIQSFAVSWRRWYNALQENPKVNASVLPETIGDLVEQIRVQLRKLEEQAGRELQKRNADRKERTITDKEKPLPKKRGGS